MLLRLSLAFSRDQHSTAVLLVPIDRVQARLDFNCMTASRPQHEAVLLSEISCELLGSRPLTGSALRGFKCDDEGAIDDQRPQSALLRVDVYTASFLPHVGNLPVTTTQQSRSSSPETKSSPHHASRAWDALPKDRSIKSICKQQDLILACMNLMPDLRSGTRAKSSKLRRTACLQSVLFPFLFLLRGEGRSLRSLAVSSIAKACNATNADLDSLREPARVGAGNRGSVEYSQ